MDTYSFLRELADSWVLLMLFAFFVGAAAWAFRPGARGMHDEAARVPFRHDDPDGEA
ncbi:cbb3-type cytochrome c oxidase subunit 3 [Jannaschia sp. Os4]|uniref:cbb3-type cytochrome c oxidase subunit 3 n=1 Tax=Jannaschia sp. Os4 TaxID=2807617 RepID=UPI00193A1CB1|nr:cbb3-type cytochrome c oxidase subunit 3 [Jannaschia sp. Os4]MBM2576457.1 cbb3-type cytochrome c oxidase subunit 3 [Jannaschia sp. Os4]